MKKTKKVLNLMLVLSLVISIIAPIGAYAATGDSFSGSMCTSATNGVTWFHSPVTGYENIHNVKLAVTQVATEGYQNGYATKIAIPSGAAAGDFFYIGFPSGTDLFGLKNFSFYTKGDVSFKFHLQDVATGSLANIVTTASSTYNQYSFTDLEDKNGYSFANLFIARIEISGIPATGGNIYFSNIQYSGVRPAPLPVLPHKYSEFQLGNLGQDWDNIWPAKGDNGTTFDPITFSNKDASKVPYVGYAGAKSYQVTFTGLNKAGRVGLIIPPPPAWQNFAGFTRMSFLIKNLNPSPDKAITLKIELKDKSKTTRFTTNFTLPAANGDWIEVNCPIEDSSGNNFANLERFVINNLPTGYTDGKLLISKLIFSTETIPTYTHNPSGIYKTSLKVNNVENSEYASVGVNAVQATLANYAATDKNVLFVTAVYDTTTTKIVDINVVNTTVAAMTKIDTPATVATCNVTVPNDSSKTYELKSFIWDSSSLKELSDSPILDVFTQ